MSKDGNDLVYITLDRPRFLHFGHKALKKLSALTGKGLEDMGASFDPEQVEAVIYCGLLKDAKENNETLKLEDMEELLDQAANYKEIIEAMTKAMSNAFGSSFTDEGTEKN